MQEQIQLYTRFAKMPANFLAESMSYSSGDPVVELSLTRLRENTTVCWLLVNRWLLLLATLLKLSPRLGCSLHLLSVPDEPAERRKQTSYQQCHENIIIDIIIVISVVASRHRIVLGIPVIGFILHVHLCICLEEVAYPLG
jgi:hypothetical protein